MSVKIPHFEAKAPGTYQHCNPVWVAAEYRKGVSKAKWHQGRRVRLLRRLSSSHIFARSKRQLIRPLPQIQVSLLRLKEVIDRPWTWQEREKIAREDETFHRRYKITPAPVEFSGSSPEPFSSAHHA